jgi:hypothetical protein
VKIKVETVKITSELLNKFEESEDMTYLHPEVMRWDVSFRRARVILKQGHCWVFKKQKKAEKWNQVYTCKYWHLQHVHKQIIQMVEKIYNG